MDLKDLQKLLQEELKPIKERVDRLSKIEERIEEILVDKAKNRLDIMSTADTVKSLRAKTDIIKIDVEKIHTVTSNLEKRIHTIEQNMVTKTQLKETATKLVEDIGDMISEMTTHMVATKEFKELEKRVTTLEQN